MKIFVAEATGAIGRPPIAQLLAKGHDVVALTRSSEKARLLVEQGVEPAFADIFDADAVKAAIAHAQPDVAIEQLTAYPRTYTRESMSAAAEQGDSGIYVIAGDRPLQVREWLPAFARWLSAPPPPQVSVEEALHMSGADAVYYGTQMRGVSNAKAKHELNFQPRSLEWFVGFSAVTHAN